MDSKTVKPIKRMNDAIAIPISRPSLSHLFLAMTPTATHIINRQSNIINQIIIIIFNLVQIYKNYSDKNRYVALIPVLVIFIVKVK